jgi:hypothetical protein
MKWSVLSCACLPFPHQRPNLLQLVWASVVRKSGYWKGNRSHHPTRGMRYVLDYTNFRIRVINKVLNCISSEVLRASSVVLDPHLHLHFFINDADAYPRMYPSGHPKLYLRMKANPGTDALPA